MKKLVFLTLAIATAAIAIIIGLVQLLDAGAEFKIGPFDSSVVAAFPSIARAAVIAASPISIAFVILGGLIVGYFLSAGITDQQIGSNDKEATVISNVGAFVGIGLILTAYLTPAYHIQPFTHITVKTTDAVKITNRSFTVANAPDPGDSLYLQGFRRN